MIYLGFQAFQSMMEPYRLAAEATVDILRRPMPDIYDNPWRRYMVAGSEILARARLAHTRPPFGIDSVTVGNRQVEVMEEPVSHTPFCTLLHFKKDVQTRHPPVLVLAPMSGHFATLLRDTVRTMLPDHDVYLTDWHNARDIPLDRGPFGFNEYVDHVIQFLEVLGRRAHLLAVCQPCVAALAAVAIMAEDDNPAQPRSMTLMAGPIDTRIKPTKVDLLATQHPIEWFEHNLIDLVPFGSPGARRRVYPGFLQLMSFMGMNLGRHAKSFHDLFSHLALGERDKAEVVWNFYDEYFAVMDLPAEFFLETVRTVFQEHALPKGELTWRGRRIDTTAIRRPHLLTIEGERDDICAVGQTLAAQDLCTNIRPSRRRHYVQAGVGHYGAFSGKRWNSQIYPIVRDTIHASA
jgi:poly(3-hydroxybutyrate) depolymerase